MGAGGYARLMPFVFPSIYPILDRSFVPATERASFLAALGRGLADSGVTLLEYRNKQGSDEEIVADATVLRESMPAVKLILDDRADLVERIGFDGVHVDAGDLSVAEARQLLGPMRIVGTYGGTEAFVPGILNEPADYFSIGPIGVTTTKETTKALIGAEGVRRLRAAAGPNRVLVAAGGVTLANAVAVLAAGANTVAVAAGIFAAVDPVAEFSNWLRTLT
jgi:thiamine-phosphate pyrophosphorylase